jgi:hypothetical protein
MDDDACLLGCCAMESGYRCFGCAFCLHHPCDRPDSHISTRRRENLKSHFINDI